MMAPSKASMFYFGHKKAEKEQSFLCFFVAITPLTKGHRSVMIHALGQLNEGFVWKPHRYNNRTEILK
jgi:hypothetical protein